MMQNNFYRFIFKYSNISSFVYNKFKNLFTVQKKNIKKEKKLITCKRKQKRLIQ